MSLFRRHKKFEDQLKEQLGDAEYKPSESLWDRIDSGITDDGFEAGMQQSLENFEQVPYPETWEKIAAELPEERVGNRFFNKYYVIGLMAMIMFTGTYLGYRLSRQPETVSTEQQSSSKVALNEIKDGQSASAVIPSGTASDAGISVTGEAATPVNGPIAVGQIRTGTEADQPTGSSTVKTEGSKGTVQPAMTQTSNTSVVGQKTVAGNRKREASTHKRGSKVSANGAVATNLASIVAVPADEENGIVAKPKGIASSDRSNISGVRKNEPAGVTTGIKADNRTVGSAGDANDVVAAKQVTRKAESLALSKQRKTVKPGVAASSTTPVITRREAAPASDDARSIERKLQPQFSNTQQNSSAATGKEVSSSSQIAEGNTGGNATGSATPALAASTEVNSNDADHVSGVSNPSSGGGTTGEGSAQQAVATENKPAVQELKPQGNVRILSEVVPDSTNTQKLYQPEPEGEKISPVSISILTGINVCYTTYEAPENFASRFEKNIALRKQVERPDVDWSGAFMLDIRLSERWMFSSGVGMVNFNQKVTYNTVEAVNPGTANEPGASVSNPQDSVMSGSSYNSRIKYSWTEVPIYISYTIVNRRKINVDFQTGVSYAFINTIDAGIIGYDNKGILTVRNEDAFPQISSTIFFSVMPQVSYKFNDLVSLGIVPSFKYSLTSIVGNERWVQQHPYFLGINLCLRKRF